MGQRAGSGYWGEISAILVLKVVGIVILYGLFFAPAERPALTAETVAAHVAQGATGQNGGQK